MRQVVGSQGRPRGAQLGQGEPREVRGSLVGSGRSQWGPGGAQGCQKVLREVRWSQGRPRGAWERWERLLAADEPRHCAGWELNLPGGPFGRYFMGCFSLVSGSGAEEPWWGQQTFVGVTGSQPRSNTSVWGRERVVREG